MNGTPQLKRKPEDFTDQPKSKAPRIEQRTPVAPNRLPTAVTNGAAVQRPTASSSAVPIPYRGTARGAVASIPAKVVPKPSTSTAQPAAAAAPRLDTAGPPKAKRGFQAAIEKAKAAQEAAKTTGMIKHKPVEKLTKRDRLRLQQEAVDKQKAERGKNGKSILGARSRSAEPADVKPGLKSKEQRQREESSYKGTMRPAPKEMSSYRGTMRAPGSAPPRSRPDDPRAGKVGAKPKDKYAGYASWSDLDDDELDDGEDEEDFESGSSDMEAGLDDVEEEEQRALRAARQEDQEALREEERLKNEKLARKKKLEQLSKAAAQQKKRF